MKRQSIFFTITITFVISLLLVISSFVVLLINDYKNESLNLKKKYFPIVKMIIKSSNHHNRNRANKDILSQNLEDVISSMNLEIISDEGLQNAISYNPSSKVLIQRKFKKSIARVISLNDVVYIYVKHRGDTFLLKDNAASIDNTRMYIILVFLVIFLTLIISFLTTIKKLYPIVILKDKVKMLGAEHFDFECCNTDKQDEVSLLAKEFKNSADKLKQIKEARNIFIRNIMHELKTPITKGKFLGELEHTEENDEKMKSVFSRLELLINEFSAIEELISSTVNIEKNEYFLNDIIDNASDMLLLEDNNIINSSYNFKLLINYKLFCVAVKNLIDNAVKYSPNSQVEIKSNSNNEIMFINEGPKLLHPLESYFEPFFANEDKSKDGFGLGLYITNSILKANSSVLEYKYENNKNIFTIVYTDTKDT
ncbi:MAG: HAMP domain-containing histidine kinase [Campylobacteraceae bacterium]|nr:HAMP domain-containing histidine kinase [Campylobacteraceae bacterium]